MTIFQTLGKRSKLFYVFLIVLGAANSILYSGLLIVLNRTITGNVSATWAGPTWLVFVSLILLSLVCNKIFQTYMVHLTNDVIFNFESSILQKVRATTYESFEKIGTEKVYAAIGDTKMLGQMPEVIINLINSGVLVLCALGYLLTTSLVPGLLVLAFMGALLVLYLYRNKSARQHLGTIRTLQNNYYRYLQDLLYGFKEIKMSVSRNDTLYNEYLLANRVTSKKLVVLTSIRYLTNELIGSYSWYAVLAILLFGLPQVMLLTSDQITTFVVTILFLVGPIASLITFIPVYTKVQIALERVEQLNQVLNTAPVQAEASAALPGTAEPFESLSFKDVTYTYCDHHTRRTFEVGPIDLEFAKGETVFITGGNGSGKSTFVNLITGLYKPKSGRVLLNGREVATVNNPYYTHYISAIFTNSHLFSENYDGLNLREPGKLEQYVELMQLSEAISIDYEGNRISNNLSKGQQKRLLMTYALLENRPVLVLDEWAAEQDPSFRHFFYKYLLAELKKAGKTVIAITHDDAYYAYADRLIKFDYGKIVSDDLVSEGVKELTNS